MLKSGCDAQMKDIAELQERLDRIEEICETYLDTPGFPKNVIMKHVIGVAKGKKSNNKK